jgi:hypothetical protein
MLSSFAFWPLRDSPFCWIKSDGPGESARVKEYLGFILDTEQMCVTVPEHKLIWIMRDLGIFLEKSRHSCRVVASIMGRLNSLEAALGTELYVSTRMSTNELVAASDQWGWDSDIFLSDDAVLGLVWLLGALDELNGHPIHAPHTCISLASVLPRDSEISLDRKIPAGWYQSLMASLASDASDTAVAAFCIGGLPQFEMVSELLAEERTYSSSRRELIASSRVLALYGELLLSKGPVTIWWLTDNSNVAKFLSKGSGVRKIMIQILDIFHRRRVPQAVLDQGWEGGPLHRVQGHDEERGHLGSVAAGAGLGADHVCVKQGDDQEDWPGSDVLCVALC